MHHVDPDNHRQRVIIRGSMYAIFSALLVAVTFLFVLAAQGYDYDRQTGAIIHNGLVMLRSKPVAAEVYINGSKESSNTPARLALPEGEYDLELRAKGYRTWSHPLKVVGSTLHWYSYPLLISQSPVTSPVRIYDDMGIVSQSLNQNRLLVQTGVRAQTFDRYDLSAPQASPVRLRMPEAIYDRTGNLSVVEWADNNRHVLLRHEKPNSTPNYLVFDTEQPGRSVSLKNRQIANHPDLQVTLRDGDWNRLLVVSDQTLRTIDIASNSPARILARNVSEAISFDGSIYAVSDINDRAAIRRYTEEGWVLVYSNPQLKTELVLRASSYENETQLAAWDKTAGLVYVIANPQDADDDTPARSSRVVKLRDIQNVGFAPLGRFLMVRSPDKVVVLDFEALSRYQLLPSTDTPTSSVRWLDEFRLIENSNDKVTMMDFDGYNRALIRSSDPNRTAYLSSDKRYIYSIRPSAKTSQSILELTNLRASP